MLASKKFPSLKPAAVMIALVERNNSLSLLLTKRAQHLKHHPGQISFPGGKVEDHDKDLIETAIRETQEETGIILNRSDILGQLQPLPTITGYLVNPIIGFASSNYQTLLDTNEVEFLFELPISHIISANSIKHLIIQRQNVQYPIYAFQFQHHFIWGATAQILFALKEQINSFLQ